MPRQIRPRALQIEASSHCQLRCPSCPTTQGAIHPAVGSGFLRPDDFQRLLEANPEIRHVELSNNGEVFLNPRLTAILEIAHTRGVTVSVANGTNLNHLREDVAECLVKYRVRMLTVAIDGASQETYRRYRVRGDFGRVIANVGRINHWKRQYGSDLPHLCWQFVVFGYNQHEVPVAQRMADRLGMSFTPKLSWDEAFSPPTDADAVRRLFGAATRSEFAAANGRHMMDFICHQLWDSPQINWDGKMLGCCQNTWGDFGANAFRDGVTEAVNSDRMVYAREMLLGRAAPRDDIPCTTCGIYRTMRDAGGHLRRDDLARGQTLTLEEALDLAARWEADGRVADAVALYRKVLAASAGHPEASSRLAALADVT